MQMDGSERLDIAQDHGCGSSLTAWKHQTLGVWWNPKPCCKGAQATLLGREKAHEQTARLLPNRSPTQERTFSDLPAEALQGHPTHATGKHPAESGVGCNGQLSILLLFQPFCGFGSSD